MGHRNSCKWKGAGDTANDRAARLPLLCYACWPFATVEQAQSVQGHGGGQKHLPSPHLQVPATQEQAFGAATSVFSFMIGSPFLLPVQTRGQEKSYSRQLARRD